MMKLRPLIPFLLLVFATLPALAQELRREIAATAGTQVEIVNNYGRIEARTSDPKSTETSSIAAFSSRNVVDSELRMTREKNRIVYEVVPTDVKKRVDLVVTTPARSSVRLRTNDGEIKIAGDFASVDAQTGTGTIAADVPLEDLSYNFIWTASRPRYVADVVLADVREKSAGRFVITGKVNKQTPKSTFREAGRRDDEEPESNDKDEKKPIAGNSLTLTTARGIVLLNVAPNEVPSDLRDRPLTKAAKAIVRSGDSLLMEAIRRASPKYFGEYAATLPPAKFEPTLNLKTSTTANMTSGVKKVLVRVTDINNRAVSGLTSADFEVLERGEGRDIIGVDPTTAPFNLVLLLDVSGSVEYYVDFIRKAARAFVQTADKNDRIAIVIFNEDVKQIASFTTDKGKLSESLDTFDAGGGTSYYDSLAFVLADTLRPLRGERSAVVVLTDGDDNHSFLPFDALAGSIQESGALIYPLYVPSGLIAISNADLNAKVDPLRAKYMGLTTKATGEGEKLAQISGGVYYPITQLTQIQKAYDDIVMQLRTAYTVTFKSDLPEVPDKTAASPRLKVKIKREGAFVKLGAVVEAK